MKRIQKSVWLARSLAIMIMCLMMGGCTFFFSANGNIWIIDDAETPKLGDTGLAIGVGTGNEEMTTTGLEPKFDGGVFLFGLSLVLVGDGSTTLGGGGGILDIDILRNLGLQLSESKECGLTWGSETPNNIGDVTVSRSIFAPQTPYFSPALLPSIGEDYIRYIDKYTNTSGSPREVVAVWLGLPGISETFAPVVVSKTSDNDTTIENSDTFVVTINNSDEDPEGPSEGLPLGFALRNSSDVSFLGGLLFNISGDFGVSATGKSPSNSPLYNSSVTSLVNSVPGEIDAVLAGKSSFLANGSAEIDELRALLGRTTLGEASVGILLYGHRFTLQPGESKSLAYFLYQGRPEAFETESVALVGGCGGDGEPACPGEEIEKARMTMAALVANPDFRCITPTERAGIINWPTFNVTLQSDSSESLFFLNSQTGDYQFTTCGFNGLTVSGTGRVTRRGCTITLQDIRPDRRVVVSIDTCTKKGTASIQLFAQGRTFTITDKNTANNVNNCAGNLSGL